jgi:biopolymer transport protein ExbB/TolQ
MQSISRLFDVGGWALVAILVLSGIGWGVMMVKWNRFQHQRRLYRKWFEAFCSLRAARDFSGIEAACRQFPCTAARAVEYALHSGGVERRFARHLEAFIGDEASRGRSRLGLIAIIAGLLPMLGLLGTVVGMIQTFDVIKVGKAADPQALAGGITQALLTTEAGLLTALPILLGHVYLRGRMRQELDEAGLLARQVHRLQGQVDVS